MTCLICGAELDAEELAEDQDVCGDCRDEAGEQFEIEDEEPPF